jgi:hypothetical protein
MMVESEVEPPKHFRSHMDTNTSDLIWTLLISYGHRPLRAGCKLGRIALTLTTTKRKAQTPYGMDLPRRASE